MKGLTKSEVEERKRQGLVNGNFAIHTKSIGQIITGNICTLFNFINLFLAVCLLLVGSYKNMLFLGVVFWNVLIGVIQEIRSKRVIDRLSLLTEPMAEVLRDGEINKIPIEEIVIDDVFVLKHGNQVCTDAVILEGECELNESLLTGESEPVFKKVGDELLSGSFVLSGKVVVQAVHVGKDNYVNKITSQAKYIKKPNSELLKAVKKIIKMISIVLIPVTLLLFARQMHISDGNMEESVVSTVAAVIGMIPSGLVLLISVVLAVSVIRLGKKNTLVQELYCIENLARVDTLCLDKTGTITEGKMVLEEIISLQEDISTKQIEKALYYFAKASQDENPTFCAVREYIENYNNEEVENDSYQIRETVAFSSDKKWSLVDFKGEGCYVLGAMEFILPNQKEQLAWRSISYTKAGMRVLLLAHSDEHCDNKQLPNNLEPYAFLILTDKIRENAPKTLEYFANQGVTIKIISGDNPQTVSNIAKRSGLKGYKNYIDTSLIHSDEELEQAAVHYTIFGRVSPNHKLKIVQALQKKGHIVAMTGDGVNDVMALKEADCSIAMQSGSDAARNVSQIVLLDSDFSSMPDIVAEGRRTINNVQRSAALYLTKTIYSVILAVLFLILPVEYPFQPIQLTLIGSLTIGIPSFILALEPNHNRVRGTFLGNVLKFAVPGSFLVMINIMAAELFGSIAGLSEKELSTVVFLSLAVASVVVLLKVSLPLQPIRLVMVCLIICVLTVAFICFGEFFELFGLEWKSIIFIIILTMVSVFLHKVLFWLYSRYFAKKYL